MHAGNLEDKGKFPCCTSNEIYLTSEKKRLRGDHGMMIMMMMVMVMMIMLIMIMIIMMMMMIIIMIILISNFDLKLLIRKVSHGKNFITMFRCHPDIIIE